MQSTDSPKVSVLTPIYHTNPQYLRECIESILRQTFTDFEFLILNDSPDDLEIEKIVLEYAARDPRIQYRKNEKNLGISESRNRLLDWSRGEYVAIFDHDDISLPERLEKEVAVLEEDPLIGVVSGKIMLIPKNVVLNAPEKNMEIKLGLMAGCCVRHSACMIRKSVLAENAVRYEARVSPAEDYMLFLQLIRHTMFYNIQDVMIHYRDDGNNTSYRQKARMWNGDALCRCYAEKEYPYLNRIGFHPYEDRYFRLFDCIPLLKIRQKNRKIKVLLFGFLPLFSIKM